MQGYKPLSKFKALENYVHLKNLYLGQHLFFICIISFNPCNNTIKSVILLSYVTDENIMWLAKNYTASKWQDQDLKPGFCYYRVVGTSVHREDIGERWEDKLVEERGAAEFPQLFTQGWINQHCLHPGNIAGSWWSWGSGRRKLIKPLPTTSLIPNLNRQELCLTAS